MNTARTITEALFKHTPFALACAMTVFAFLTAMLLVFLIERAAHKQRQHSRYLQKLIADHAPDETIIAVYRQQKPIRHLQIIRYVCCAIFFFSCISIAEFAVMYHTAKQHGFTDQYTETVHNLWDNIQYSPIEDVLPTKKTNIAVIYYRFGCEDCKLIHEELTSRITPADNVYWVNTRSKQGIALRESYPIPKVPTAIYINENGIATTYVLYKKSTQQDRTVIEVHQKNIAQLNEQIAND